MRFFASILVILFGLLALAAAVAQPEKDVIISFASDAPNEIVEKAKDMIRDAGGRITHEYNIIKGFACTGTQKMFEMVTALSDQYPPRIEDDQVVSIQGGSTAS